MFSVCVENEYVGLMGRHVTEGQMVTPGAPLIDVMTPDGIVETIFSQGWGVVAHIEGGRIFSAANSDERPEDDEEDDSEDGESGSARGSGSGTVFPKGSMICHIVARDGKEAGTIKGLTPRPTTVMANRYQRLMYGS
ncbi:MAG: hypothetical protein WCD70_00245 [Alphaproteobacteria bacterium]